MNSLLFRNDKRLRDKLYTPESYQHPAKANLYMMQTIIEKYTQPGETILDPMGGVGSTMIAALMGRSVVLVELEEHFISLMKASWEKMKMHPMLGCELGEVLIIRGDARCLPLGSADHIITSPPFQDLEPFQDKEFNLHGTGPVRVTQPSAASYTRPSAIITSPPFEDQVPNHLGGSTDFSQVGGIGHERVVGYTRPAAIITSPPYEEHHQGGTDPHPEQMSPQGRQAGHTGERYTRPVDAVVTSPPYEGTIQGAHDGVDWAKQADGRKKQEPHGVGAHPWSYSRPTYEKLKASVEAGEYQGLRPDVWTSPTNFAAHGYLDGYSEQAENIGNLHGQAYWGSMRLVYQECFRILRPGGIMALILKGFTRDGQYVDLPAQTQALCESLGFTKFDEWQRELWSLSFWRILQKRRDPAAFDDRLKYETILAFRKSPLSPFLAGKGEEG